MELDTKSIFVLKTTVGCRAWWPLRSNGLGKILGLEMVVPDSIKRCSNVEGFPVIMDHWAEKDLSFSIENSSELVERVFHPWGKWTGVVDYAPKLEVCFPGERFTPFVDVPDTKLFELAEVSKVRLRKLHKVQADLNHSETFVWG